MTQKQFIPMESNLLNKEIQAIGKTGAKLNVRIQIAALNACWYSIQHGDIGFGQRLLLSLSAGHRKNSLVAFFEKHGKFQWNKELKSLVFRKREDVNIDSIAEVTEQWHEALKEPEIKSAFDFDEDAAKFLKRMEKAIKQDNAVIKNVGLYDAIAEAVAKYHADQIDLSNEEDEEIVEDQPIEAMEADAIEEEIKARLGIRMAA